MERFVTKKARLKQSRAIVVPRSSAKKKCEEQPEPEQSPAPPLSTAPTSLDDEVEEDISDRDEVFDKYWQEKAGKRQSVREKRKKMEAAPRTIKEHFAKPKDT